MPLYIEKHFRRILTRIRSSKNYAIFIDQSVLKTLFKKEGGLEPFLLDNYWLKKTDKIDYICTPFLLIEYIGINPIPQPAPFIFSKKITDKNINEVMLEVFKYAKDFFSEEPKFRIKSLKEIANNKKNHLPPSALPLFYRTILRFITPTAEDEIHTLLAWDFVSKTHFPHHHKRKFQMSIIAHSYLATDKGIDLPVFRTACDMLTTVVRSNKSISKENKNESDAYFGLKRNGDYIDSELIQIAILGRLIDKNLRVPAHCFTNDKPEVIFNRIKGAKTAMRAFKEIYLDERKKNKKLPALNFESLPGVIHCVDERTLKVVNSFDVARLPDK